MRTLLDDELDKVRTEISLLGAQASQATALAMHALLHCDLQEARQVKRNDQHTDELRYHVETTCLNLIATQQPVARDLRELVAFTFVAVELERCADYAKGIAKAARRISRTQTSINTFHLIEMGILAQMMLERAVATFISSDRVNAFNIIADDDNMDALYGRLVIIVTAQLLQQNMSNECGVWLLHSGHCLERISDRATNIAMRTLFVATGELRPILPVQAPTFYEHGFLKVGT